MVCDRCSLTRARAFRPPPLRDPLADTSSSDSAHTPLYHLGLRAELPLLLLPPPQQQLQPLLPCAYSCALWFRSQHSCCCWMRPRFIDGVSGILPPSIRDTSVPSFVLHRLTSCAQLLFAIPQLKPQITLTVP
ncbi:hypothetical protein EVAR_78211_1 [Eumeta japonica]|uniref:Uncharacterized protein n=1 Tax=Eumeta variegata TaxID=151549 RepID=A0A4C1TS18_EUMVA|nr:hypothetical protein EVAR_78211_1 [Eumeta japonica]